MEWGEFKVSKEAIEDGKRLGLTGDVEAQILAMAKRSAILTYPGANRRYHDFALNIVEQTVLSLQPFDRATNVAALAAKKAAKRRERARLKHQPDEL